PWAKSVARVVLVAGMNRGWSFSPRPSKMSAAYALALRVGTTVARWVHVGGLVLAVRRGEPFVANLRVQWLNVARRAAGGPPSIELLGAEDELVTPDDNADLIASGDFFFREAGHTTHAGILSMRDSRPAFEYALMTPVAELKSDLVAPPVADPNVDEVVFVM